MLPSPKTADLPGRGAGQWRDPAAGRSVDDVIDRSLFHRPRPGFPFVAGQGEAMPIFVVQLRMIRPIIVSRPPRFRPEQGVLRDTFRGQGPVLELPCALKLVGLNCEARAL